MRKLFILFLLLVIAGSLHAEVIGGTGMLEGADAGYSMFERLIAWLFP